MATRGDIKNQIIQWSHRTDLTSLADQFIDNVTTRLNRRLGITLAPMVNANESNIIAEHNPDIYLYGALREMAIYTSDNTATQTYDGLYQQAVDRLNITYNGAEWDNSTLAILNETEQELADAT